MPLVECKERFNFSTNFFLILFSFFVVIFYSVCNEMHLIYAGFPSLFYFVGKYSQFSSSMKSVVNFVPLYHWKRSFNRNYISFPSAAECLIKFKIFIWWILPTHALSHSQDNYNFNSAWGMWWNQRNIRRTVSAQFTVYALNIIHITNCDIRD